jgi:hypothetical protein
MLSPPYICIYTLGKLYTNIFANFTQRRHEPDGKIYCTLGYMPSVLFPRQKSAEGVFKENSNGQEA